MTRPLSVVLLLLLLGAIPVAAAESKKLVLLSQAPDGHPLDTHEYVAGLQILHKCLDKIPGLEITTTKADEPWRDGPELLAKADGAVLFLSEGAKWLNNNPERLAAFKKLASRKGGLAVIHWAMGTKDAKNIEPFVALFGGCHGGPDRKYKVLSADAIVTTKHPITRGIDKFNVRDEFYYTLKTPKDAKNWEPILRVPIDGKDETVAWAWTRPDGGRSFGFSGLHFHDNWRLVEYRRLVTQGVLWTMDVAIPDKGLPVRVADQDLKIPR
jgi:Trehalose utilisation